MKQNRTNTLSVETVGKKKQNIVVLCLTALLVLTGFWGVLFQAWTLEEGGAFLFPVVVLLSGCISCGLMVIREKGTWYARVLILLVAILALVLPVAHKAMGASLGWLMNHVGQWRFLHTGWYVRGFEADGAPWMILLVLSVLSGILAQLLVQNLNGQLMILPVLVWMLLLAVGVLDYSSYGLLLAAGCALALVSGFSGELKSWLFTLAMGLAVGAAALGIALLFRIQGPDGAAGRKLQNIIHKSRYESSEISMPEGQLSDLGAFSKTEEPALEVSMSSWKTLYLRGFQGGVYNGNSWESLSPEELDEEKELLCSLQESGFYASSQIAEGWRSLGKQPEDTITVTNTGACSAWQYLPYAADSAEQLEPMNIQGEGTPKQAADSVLYKTYAPEDSYLLMKELYDAAEKGQSQEYLEKEKSYRDFVYKHYLSIPEQTETLLRLHKLKGQKGIATTQACRETRLLLKETIKSNEAAVFYNHSGDFLEYLLDINPSGYSVQYATLAVMMLRTYGIPARYVEGYYLAANDTRELKSGDTVQLTQKNGAAWVEYYADGVGWLVFDPTPSHTQTIDYQLPVGQGDADLKAGNIGFSDRNQKQKEQDTEEDEEIRETSGKKSPGMKAPVILLIIVLAILLLALIALVIRTVILRGRMRRQRAVFADPDPRIATAAMLCCLRKLVCQSLRLPEAAFFENPDEMVTTLLDMEPEEFQAWKGVSDEIMFSRHEISEETKNKAGHWLADTESSWKAGVSLPRRLLHRYILCDVY